MGTAEEQFIHPGSPRAKAARPRFEFKNKLGCLGICLGLLFDLSLSQVLCLTGVWLAQSFCFPTSLLPSLSGQSLYRSVWEAVNASPSKPALPHSASPFLCTLERSFCFACIYLSGWLAPNAPAHPAGFYPWTPKSWYLSLSKGFLPLLSLSTSVAECLRLQFLDGSLGLTEANLSRG